MANLQDIANAFQAAPQAPQAQAPQAQPEPINIGELTETERWAYEALIDLCEAVETLETGVDIIDHAVQTIKAAIDSTVLERITQ